MKRKEKNIDTKIDELARMVAQGFTETHVDINRLETKVDGIEENYVIKADLVRLRGDIDIMLEFAHLTERTLILGTYPQEAP